MSSLRKRLACLNYRMTEEITVTVTRKAIRAYTPRVKAALKAVGFEMGDTERDAADRNVVQFGVFFAEFSAGLASGTLTAPAPAAASLPACGTNARPTARSSPTSRPRPA